MRILVLLLFAGIANAECFQTFQTVQTVQHVPVIQEQVLVPQFQFLVGNQIRMQALQTELNALQEFQEFQQFQAFKAQRAQQQAAQPQQAPMAQCANGTCSTSAQVQAAPRSVLLTTCARCHAGQSPAAGIALDGSTRIDSDTVARTLEMLLDPSTAPAKMQPVLEAMPEGQSQELLTEMMQLWR